MNFLRVGIMLMLLFSFSTVHAIGNSFTYQGQLQFSGSDAEGSFDFEFKLYNSENGGTQIGGTELINAVNVSAGVFTVDLDFGSGAFGGDDRWLEIKVKANADINFTALNPRQMVNPSPYAIHAGAATAADSAASVPYSGVTGVPADIADGDNDTLSLLSCADGQIAVLSGANWVCGTPADSDTLAALVCTQDQIAAYNGSGWECRSPGTGSASEVCMTASGSPGLLINGICLLGYKNSSAYNWNTAATVCATLGGDLCTVSQYDGLRGEGSIASASTSNDGIFSLSQSVWSSDFSDNDGNWKGFALNSSDDPSDVQSYGYGCCRNVLAEPIRSQAEIVNGVLVTYTHTDEDTSWRAAARVCRSQGADLCTKSQYVALNDAVTFSATVRRATSEMSDNDSLLFSPVVGTNTADNPLASHQFAYSCCSTARPIDLSCSGTTIGGVCVVSIHDTEDTDFYDAARACTSLGADVCSKSQMQVIRNGGQFLGACWTNDGADNDGSKAGGLLGSQPDNPNPGSTLMGYACCQ